MATESESGSQRDDAVLWVVIGFCLLVPVVLTSLWAYSNRFYPPMLLAVLLGIAIAALTYRYLGGTTGASLSFGAMKLAGSAALLLGTAYMTNSGLSAQMEAENLPNKLATLRGLLTDEIAKKEEAQKKIASMQDQLESALANRAAVSLSEIEKLSPTSLLGSRLAEMARKRQGPFSEVEKVLDVNVTVIDAIKDKDSFSACSNFALDGEDVRLSRELNEEPKSIRARQTGTIESVVCERRPRKFDLQLSCAAGHILFPDHIAGCSDKGEVKWKIAKGTRYFPVSLEVLAR